MHKQIHFGRLLKNDPHPIEMNVDEALDIDSMDEFEYVEQKYKKISLTIKVMDQNFDIIFVIGYHRAAAHSIGFLSQIIKNL